MSTKDDVSTQAVLTFQDDLAEISRLLTAIARRTYTGANNDARRHDFGEVVAISVTAAAANLGSVDALLAGRPGSWEADYVRQIVGSSAPDDQLHLYRTEPVRLILDPKSVFEDLGLQDLFEEEDNLLSQGYDNGTGPYDGGENDAAIDARRAGLETMYCADLDAYFSAYVAVIGQIVGERGFTVPVEVTRVDEYQTEPFWDALAVDLHAMARERTPLPSGIALKDYEGSVAATEQAEKRSYLDRLNGNTAV